MNTSTNVVRLRQPEEFEDPLTDILRSGARRLLAQAVELEAEAFLARMQDLKLPDGRDRLVRHGHGPERMIQTGIGPVAVSRVKIRDRGAASDDDRVRFSSSILPKWARRTRSLDALLPILYLRGVSTGDFQEALAALLGRDAPNLSPSVIARLSGEWQAEYEHWQRRDLSARRYVYLWADGVYLQARMEEHAECMLVMIGATPEGGKELVGFQVGVRESTQSWRELLVEVKRRGLTIAPEIAVGDGALGFWKALDEIYPRTRHQRCWLHKTANVLNKVPRAVQATMKVALREIHGAERRREVIAGLTGAAASLLPARAQQQIPVIGFLSSASAGQDAGRLRGFRLGLSEMVYVEGRNVAIEYRWAEERTDLLPALASDLVSRNVAVIASLMESGVDFTAVDFPRANRLTVHILAAVAEHEAERSRGAPRRRSRRQRRGA